MMARRGIQLTYETVREWCDKFGPCLDEDPRLLDALLWRLNVEESPLQLATDRRHASIYGHPELG